MNRKDGKVRSKKGAHNQEYLVALKRIEPPSGEQAPFVVEYELQTFRTT